MKRNFLIILFLFSAGVGIAQPKIDSMVVPGPDSDTIYLHGKFGSQPGKAFLDTSEMQIYRWTDTLVTAHLLPFFVGSKAECGPVTVNASGIVSNARILSIGWVQGNTFPYGDTLIQHGNFFNNYWRYDLHSFFLNHKGVTKLAVPMNMGTAIFDFQRHIVEINNDLQIALDSNFDFPSEGYYWYRPGYPNLWVHYGLSYGCSAPIDARKSFKEFLSVKAGDDPAFSFTSYPNPSSKEINIAYSLPDRANAKIILYDLEGRVIRENASDVNEGEHNLKWDISQCPSGSYVLGLVTEKERKTQIIEIMH
ncbi:MAG: T9SS type A sorting domain-containing protein [Candidatus Kapaibacterium sp.]